MSGSDIQDYTGDEIGCLVFPFYLFHRLYSLECLGLSSVNLPSGLEREIARLRAAGAGTCGKGV